CPPTVSLCPQARATDNLVRGDQNRDDRHHDEQQDQDNEANHQSAHGPSAPVGASESAGYPQHSLELLVPQVRATPISPATCRIRDVGCHRLSMAVTTGSVPLMSAVPSCRNRVQLNAASSACVTSASKSGVSSPPQLNLMKPGATSS